MPDPTVPGARVTPVPRGIATRVGEAVRYMITGVAPTTWFGPMQPLAPMAPEGTGGRAFDSRPSSRGESPSSPPSKAKR